MEFILVMLLGVLIPLLTHRVCSTRQRDRMVWILLGSYAFRLVFGALVSRNVAFFSHGVGGDWRAYQAYAELIARFWETSHFDFITAEAYPDVAPGMVGTAFICNLFALVTYLCGAPAVLGCTAVVAFIACMLCLVIYRFAIDMGATERAAFRLFVLTIFGPAFIYYTSDMYKDGVNAFLVVAVVYISVRLGKRFSLIEAALLIPTLWALYHVRPYMVFMCLLPLPIGLLGANRFGVRTVLASIVLLGAMAAGMATQAPERVVTQMEDVFEVGTAENSREYNAMGGSGVRFDDGGNPWRALGPKIAYTLFSPFPWMSGSFGLQLGKIDALIWYYLFFSALRGARVLWKEDRAAVLTLLIFIVPGTIAYATTMANVGLILRQRMPIMMVTSVLAALVWSRQEREAAKRTQAATLSPARLSNAA